MKDNTPWALGATFLSILACRLLPHPDGFTPLIAVSCLATYLLGWRGGVAALVGNVFADALIGFYDAPGMAGTYAGHLAAVGVSVALRARAPVASGLLASAAFFALSNLGVWLGGHYGLTAGGLAACYAAAIPFWKTQLCADSLLVGAVLGVLWLRSGPARPPRPAAAGRAGFTLVELLVVVAIIATLAAVMFPVFSQARAAAKKAQAMSNVRQVGLAAIMYCGDYDGVFVRDLVQAAGKTYYWWGSYDGVVLRPEEGLLFPYTRSAGVKSDPTFPVAMRSPIGLTGFGYNYAYLSPTDYDSNWNPSPRPTSESQVGSPSETLAFASSARINNWSYGSSWRLEGNPYIDPPSFQFPGVHARHAGRRAVAAWVDGHASGVPVSAPAGEFGWGMQGPWFAESSLGDVIKPGCPHGSVCQDYFYDLE